MSSNLTIRIDPKLKAQVEAVCVDADLTVSQVVRAALRDFVKKSGEKTTAPLPPRSSPARTRPENSRLLELEALERKNLLNKLTRIELKSLRSGGR